MKSRPSLGLFFLILGFTALLFTAGEKSFAAPGGGGPQQMPVVTVLAVTQREVNPPSEFIGKVEAIQAVDLRARVQGFLEQVKFEEGADVDAGELLYVIEQAPYRARVNEARAKVTEAEANLTRAKQYLQRLQAVRTGGVSATDLDTATSSELQAKARLEEARASLQRAELDLGYTLIEAPISGRIGRAVYTRGNLVEPSSGSLSRIVQLNPIRVVYSVSDNDLIEMRMAKNVGHSSNGDREDCSVVPRIRLSNGALYPAEGHLDFIDNQVDSATGTVAIRAVFDNPEGILIPGQYVTVLISCKQGRGLPVVPQSAVQEDREGRFLFVVNGESMVELRRIQTGAVLGTQWAVEQGLRAGEIVIVQGIQKVQPGQRVKTVFAKDSGPNGG